MTGAAAAAAVSPLVAWPRSAPASRGGRRAARASAFHPDVSRAVESLQAEFREVDRALALNSARVSAAFHAAHVAPHVNLPRLLSSSAVCGSLSGSGYDAHAASANFSISVARRGTATTTGAAGRCSTPSSPRSSAPRPPLSAPRFHVHTRYHFSLTPPISPYIPLHSLHCFHC